MAEPELVAYVANSTGLAATDAARLIDDVVAFHRVETVEAFVRRRHHELKVRGLKNDAIFEAIVTELADRVVAAPTLSTRQLRRIVYG